MSERIYILLPVHDRREVTKQFIECLKAQTYSNYHLLLIDDGSTDGTEEMVREEIPTATILKGNGEWWWAGSLQQGINWLERQKVEERDIVVFANDDITYEAGFLQKAVDILDGLDATLLLPQVCDEKTGMPQESGVEADMHRLTFELASSPEKINCLPTRGLFMRMSDLRRIGGFYPRLLPHYWSDYEFTIRAHRKGFKLCTSPEIAIRVDNEKTGYRNFGQAKFVVFLRQYFSKTSVINPVYHSAFIMLVSPWAYMPLNLMRVWRNATVLVLKKLKHSIKRRLEKILVKNSIRQFRNYLKVIIGSANTKQEGWISTNYPLLDLTDERTFAALFDSGTVNNFFAEHVWEHLSPEDGAKACRNCFAYLKHGGVLRIAVPDGLHPDADYIAQVKPGGCGPGADDHKVLYNYITLTHLLENAGFNVRLVEYFDGEGIFHCSEWLPDEGMVVRSSRFDKRNNDTNPNAYTSLIVDALKP